jgi:penicillin-binding protein 1A
VVLGVDEAGVEIGLTDGEHGRIPMTELSWARPWLKGQKVGPPPSRPSDVLAPGDVILVEPVTAGRDEGEDRTETYGLRQIPQVSGALVAMDPHTGRVLAMSGGFSFERSEYNRATQALRQPGSAFKPFVYLAALGSGLTPATMVLDAPLVIDQGPGQRKWKPTNYTDRFYGLAPMRVGIEKSRNLMTVRLAQTIGMQKVVDYARRFGIAAHMAPTLSMALGAGETTLLRLTTAYAMLVNGGSEIAPALIDRIQDRNGRTIYRKDDRPCDGCRADFWLGQPAPQLPDARQQIADSASVYQVVSMLQGVVERGTGRRVGVVGKPVAGKTGTTNNSVDAWFVGFSPDLAVGVYVGFDKPRPLGKDETGSSVAAPIFADFMKSALDGEPAVPFRIPPGIRLVRINAETGRLAQMGDENVILEAFKPGNEPTAGQMPAGGGLSPTGDGLSVGTGGLY